MIQLYSTRLKCLIKNKENIFWTFLFPIILATLFSMAFSNLYSSESFHTIKIALVDNEDYLYNKEFQEALTNATSDSGKKTKLFDVTNCNLKEANSLLDSDKIIGYILPGDNMELIAKTSGLNQTITKSFLESYTQRLNTLQTIVNAQPQSYPQLMKDIGKQSAYIEEAPMNDHPPNTTLNYYYALLAMASLFGCYWGLNEIINIQGDLSWKGARINVSPIHKIKLLLCNMAAAFTVHFTGVLFLLSYLTFVLKIDFGDDIGYVILTCLTSCLLGISLGAMVSSIIKKNASFKSSILAALVMFCSFLAGLMMVQMKYIVATKAPFLQYINPAHIITDAFYSLYYYDTFERFFMNIGLMIGYTLLFSLVTYLVVRRKKYASL